MSAGCLHGFQCGNSSSEVGDAPIEAVAVAIMMIVVACGLFVIEAAEIAAPFLFSIEARTVRLA